MFYYAIFEKITSINGKYVAGNCIFGSSAPCLFIRVSCNTSKWQEFYSETLIFIFSMTESTFFAHKNCNKIPQVTNSCILKITRRAIFIHSITGIHPISVWIPPMYQILQWKIILHQLDNHIMLFKGCEPYILVI